jgi:AraC family transcriptional regulator of adaptative response/methylated-DNA-[protein]-cysteine methyltransferase
MESSDMSENSQPATVQTAQDPRWQAVVARDRAFDGRFYYSVKSTGVYCRPSCSARLPKPENVRFHPTCADAERAGFRPCRRCRPNRAVLPERQAAEAAEIRFAVGACSLGALLVARSERGICSILLGDNAEALARDLQNRFPRAHLVADEAPLEELIAKVVAFLDAPRRGLDLPLDLRGTAFQRRVWQALRTIPAGETATYATVAGRIGSPTSVRAVAQACAANAIAVAIPCHRVVRADGALSGYRWGVERKRVLLERESAA